MTTINDARAVMAAKMTEAELQTNILDAAHRLGWVVFHPYDSRRSAGAGYPDLTMCHRGRGVIVFAELKTEKGRVMPAQQVWLETLQRCDVSVYVWRPRQWFDGSIMAVLRG